MIAKIREGYPAAFWTLVGASFIDQVGGFLLFPFFALYLTKRYDVGMTEVGVLFTVFAVTGLVGGMFGGALADKFGRRSLIIFGLVVSGGFSIVMGLVGSMQMFYLVAAISGIVGNAGGPARQAMVADILPPEKVTDGFGILRVSGNLAAVIGPALGGLLAAQSYFLLFVADAASSAVTAIIVFLVLPETKPAPAEDEPEQSLVQTVGGYGLVFRDFIYMGFIVVSMLMALVYFQMNSTLSVFLRDVHGVSDQQFGLILSLNAAMVVLFQFWITRRISGFPPFFMMAVGTVFYAVGFGMYGFIGGAMVYTLALAAMVVITIGEMIVAPVGQALVAKLSPEDMRGRYMAIYGMSWGLPVAVGPLAAGYVMDNLDPNLVWYAAGVIALVAVGGFLSLHSRSQERILPSDMDSPEAVVAAGN